MRTRRAPPGPGSRGEPLWRISWLQGAEVGELLLTFHHAMADGLSAMALVAAEALPAQTTATMVVNLRQLATPALPWELMRRLRVCVNTPVRVDQAQPVEALAAELHGVLQRHLSQGVPLQVRDAIAAALHDGPRLQHFRRRSWR